MFLMQLQRSIKALQQTLQQDLEEMGSKRERKDPSQCPRDHQPFAVCLGLLLKSAEVSLLLKPVPQPGSRSPLESELSPSESRATLEPGSDTAEGAEKGEKGNEVSGSEAAAAKGSCTVDQLLCGDVSESGAPVQLVPTSTSAARPDLNHRASLEERTSAKNARRRSSDEGADAVLDGVALGEGTGGGADSKTQTNDGLSDPLSGKDWSDKDKAAAAKMPQSMSRYSASATQTHHQFTPVSSLTTG